MKLNKINLKKMVRSFAIAGTLAAVVGTTAMALEIEGGNWDYGYCNWYLDIYSDYSHNSSIHGSSVQGAFFDSDYNVAPGKTSHATAEALLRGNQCYYHRGARSAIQGVELPDIESVTTE